MLNFAIQQKTKQVNDMEEGEERKDLSMEIFRELGDLQYQILSAQIDHM